MFVVVRCCSLLVVVGCCSLLLIVVCCWLLFVLVGCCLFLLVVVPSSLLFVVVVVVVHFDEQPSDQDKGGQHPANFIISVAYKKGPKSTRGKASENKK